ncbi:hypothetical protein [Chishuiella sp.]|uniref:hypothetical protein n=1 Tax=Chishuiella sp. TaxID=1969467 RepID=UPI0028A75B1E|nr:hypothetical protein [Chishuiella sp.]
MKLLIGIACVAFGLGLFILCFLLNFDMISYQILGLFLLIISLAIIHLGFKFIFDYRNYIRLVKQGLKVKAQVIDIKRTLLGENNLPDYVVEVLYTHPSNKKVYYSEFEYSGDVFNNEDLKKGHEVDILIDPENPNNIFYSNMI